VDVLPVSYDPPTTPRAKDGLEFAAGVVMGIVVVLLSFAAVSNHAYIRLAELAGLATVVLPATKGRWAVIGGALTGACALVGTCAALILTLAFTGNLTVGGP
jgi:hypothetical protein